MSDNSIKMDITTMKVADLKRELKVRGLSTAGNKSDLVERLSSAAAQGTPADQTDPNNDVTAADPTSVEATATADDAAPTSAAATAAVGEEEAGQEEIDDLLAAGDESVATTPSGNKKINLNRNNDLQSKSSEVDEDKSETELKSPSSMGDSSTAASSDWVKVVKGMSDSEKSLARAARFGLNKDDEKKQARAARFGIASSSSKIGAAPAADLDKLRQRAERFGQNNSKTMKNLENEEKIRKRRERFGVVSKNEPKAKKIMLNSGVNSIVMDEKMKKRAERFGTAAVAT